MPRLRKTNSIQDGILVKDIREVRAILRNINWNFYPQISSNYPGIHPFDCRKYHWFPATFIPEIPFTLIEVLTLPGAVVYDPFGGIGTTYFQALLLNRRPLTTEICRIAVEYMNGLFTLFDPTIDLDSLKGNIENLIKNFNPNKDYILNIPKNVSIDKLKPWFSKKTLNELSFICLEESDCTDRTMKASMRIAISAVLKAVSSQGRGWGCIADNVLPKESSSKQDQIKDKKVLDSVKGHINKLFKNISEDLKHVMPDYTQLYSEISRKQTIFYEDVRECKKILDNSVDLVVTSPPYPNMADYVTSQRLSYYFLGFDLTNDLNLEIGARRKRFPKDSLTRYLTDMKKANEVIAKKIKRGGYACFVMPLFDTDNENNCFRRDIVQKVLVDLETHDLRNEGEFERLLPTKRRHHNLKWATLEREKIYLYRKV